MTPFRFGVTAGAVGDHATWATTAARAENLGYSTLLLPDTVHTPAPLIALAAAAARTTTLRVGTWVLCDPVRNPRQLAWEAATLCELFGDRFELGIGAGRPDAAGDAEALGLPFGTPGERVARLAGTVDLLRERLPGLRILIAASGPKLLRLAGRVADIVALGWAPTTSEDEARERVEIVRQAAADRGREPELASGLVGVGDYVVPYLARGGLDAAALSERGAVTVVAGEPDAMAEQLQHRRVTLGLSYVTVPAEAMDAFAPVVERLSGR